MIGGGNELIMIEETPNNSTPRSSRTRKITMLIALVVAALFLFLAVKDVDWKIMATTIQGARYEYLAMVAVIFSINLFFRSLRWRILLSAEKPIPSLTVFWANNAGYFGNYFLPARAGELVRAAAVGDAAGIGGSYALATALTERIMDAILLVIISLTAIFTLHNLPDILVTATRTMAVVGLIGLVGIIMAPRLEKQINWVVNKLPIPERFKKIINDLLERFLLGMRSLQNPGRLFGFLAFSAVIWTIDGFCATQVAAAFNFTISLPIAFIILSALGLSSAVPSTPGYLGVYQLVTVAVMTPFGYRSSDALVFIISWQALSYILLILWGGLGIWQLKLWDRILHGSSSTQTPT
jgi:glycosyltransferase 2 family protein